MVVKPPLTTLADDLERRIADRQVVVVVGAGISLGATRGQEIASWAGLLEHGVGHVELVMPNLPLRWGERVRDQIRDGDTEELIYAAENISRRLGAPKGGEFRLWLRETVGSLAMTDPAAIEALHALGLPIATTNYDGLLEGVTGLPAVTWKEPARAERVVRGEEPGILHLHGYWQDPETVVLGVRSYEEVIGDLHAQQILRALRTMRTLLFVGYGAGLRDPNLGALLLWTRKVFAESEYRHFRLCREEEVASLQAEHPPEERIFALSFGSRHEDLAPFLYRLAPGRKEQAGSERRSDRPRLDVAPVAAAPKIYQNLPQPDYSQFVGRERELEEIYGLLSPQSRYFLITIDGIGGIGKTALALEVAQHYLRGTGELLARERFDAIIWVSAKQMQLTTKGVVPRRMAIRNLKDIFTAISITLEREDITRARFDKQPELVRNALTRQRTLLIIDNLETVDDELVMEFLHDLPAPTKAIVTTRQRIDAAYGKRLTGMPWEDAKTMIASECASKAVVLADVEQCILYERTGGVPLAMVWSIALLGGGHTLASVLHRLGQQKGDIARYCFERVLDDIRGTEAYNLLLAGALFASDAGREALGEAAGLNEDVIARDEGLAELEQRSLVNKVNARFGMLPLTRQFASLELEQHPEREQFVERWKAWLVQYAKAVHPAHWYEFNPMAMKEEMPNLQAALDWAIGQENWKLCFELLPLVCWYFNYTGLWTELIETAELGVDIARRQGDLAIEAELRSALLGFAYSQQHEFAKAIHHVGVALNIYREKLHDHAGEALALSHLAQVYRKQGQLELAEEKYQEAKQILSSRPDLHRSYISIQFELGKLARDKKDWQTAALRFDEVRKWLEMHPDDILNQSQLQGAVFGHLALVEYYQGFYDQAKTHCLESIRFVTSYNLKVAFGSLYWRLALIEMALGNPAAALEAIELAIDWFEKLGMGADLKNANELRGRIEAMLASATVGAVPPGRAGDTGSGATL